MAQLFLRRIFQFIKTNPGILFSLVLIVFIPLTLYLNTFFAAKAFQESTNAILQSQALMVENIMAAFFSEMLDQPQKIQQMILDFAKDNPQLQGLRVLKEERGGFFSIIASQYPQELGLQSNDSPLALAFSQDQAIAALRTDGSGQRFWNVIKPLYNLQKEKVGL